MVNSLHFRPAIAMIELIFAIVVLGITLMSAPTLIGVATKSGPSGSLASFQESITEVASMQKLITTYQWDQNDTNNTSPLLYLPGGGMPANMFPGRVSRSRLNGLAVPLRASVIGQEGFALNDMDDFNGRDTNLTLSLPGQVGLQGDTDYIDFDINLRTQVQYGKAGIPLNEPFSAAFGGLPGLGGANNRRNTKVITTTLTSPNFPGKRVRLSTFSCNIGSYNLKDLGGANR